MGHRYLLFVFVTLSILVSQLAAGKTKTDTAGSLFKVASHSSTSHASTPHASTPHSTTSHSSSAHTNSSHTTGTHSSSAHTNTAHGNTLHSASQTMSAGHPTLQHPSMRGPQHANAVLRAEMLSHWSRVQQHLYSAAYWHHWHHWHHAWMWGVYGWLPANSSNLVVGVPSGNTLSVTNAGGVAQRVRLAGVASPLAGQAFFSESQEHLSELANQKHVRVFQTGVDPDGSIVAQVFLRDSGVYLNERQIRDGMAFNTVDDGAAPTLASAEEEAQGARAGLWSTDSPIAPWLAEE